MKLVLQLMKNKLTPLVQTVLARLQTVTSATDATIQKKIYGSGMTALIISNKEMEGIMKTVKSLFKLGLLIKGVRETIKNEAKEQKGELLSMLLAASLSKNALASKAKIPVEGVLNLTVLFQEIIYLK